MKEKFKVLSVLEKYHHYDCKRKEYLHKKYKHFQFSMITEWINKRATVENVWEKIAESLDFVENSNFSRGSTEAAVRRLFWFKFPEKGPWRSPIIAKLHNLSL